MFKRIRKNKFTRFSILIEDLLSPFWELGKLLLGESEILNIFAPKILKDSKGVFDDQEQRPELIEKKELIFSQVFNDYVTEVTNSIINKESLDCQSYAFPILMIFKDPLNNNFFYISDSDTNNPEDEKKLGSYLKNQRIVSSFLKRTENDALKEMEAVDTPQLYSKVFKCYVPEYIEMPIIPYDYIDTEVMDGIDTENVEIIWLNYKRIHKYYDQGFPSSPQHVKALYIEQLIKGILVDNYYFPTSLLLKDSFLKQDKIFDYIWLCLKHKVVYNISHEEKKGSYNGNEQLKSFIESCKNDDFVKELSNLQDNLYIARHDLSEEGEKYFNKMLMIQNLSKLESYKFYIDEPKVENNNVFGIYQNVKLDGGYHLKYLFENKEKYLKDKHTQSLKKEIVWVLKPKIAQFFLSDFYEQLLYSALNELKQNQEIEDYLGNYNAVYSNGNKCEIDAIVKTKKKIFFIEAKTTLTLNLINEYTIKCQRIIADFEEIKDHIGFIIVGYFSHPELSVLRIAALHDEIPEGYNKEREGLANTPYYFVVPIGENPNHKLECFTELSYSKLKSTLKSVFEK